MYGGNGDDFMYGAYKALADQIIAGQGGKDTIRTDIYKDAQNLKRTLVFGDWGYGPEEDRYNDSMQYGDIHLEEKLHGDDEIIIFGNTQRFFGME